MTIGKFVAALSLACALCATSAHAQERTDEIQARHEIAELEGVFEQAVGHGAQMLSDHVQASTTAESVLLTGQARARGFRLDGYGLLFDVEFPSIRRTVVWTMKTLERKTVAAAPSRSTQPSDDPRGFYATELTGALVGALLDNGPAAGIAPDEWLTVAARESLDLRYLPDDPATTVILRVKGSDLAALHDKRITREEARKRIEVRRS